MFNTASQFVTALLLLSVSMLAQALTVEAEGQALIHNGDLHGARQTAIQSATQQASMQAAVYVSSNQQVRDGILEVDNMQITTLGEVRNVQVLKETRNGNLLTVHIRADVFTDTGCKNGASDRFLKSVAIAAFPLEHPRQGNLGGIGDTAWELPNLIASQLSARGRLRPFKATHLNIFPTLQTASSRQLDDGALTSVAANVNNLDTQFIVSGVIRDMAMVDPRVHSEDNYFVDLYNRLDYKSQKHLRNFQLDLFIHDGFSGALLLERRYQTDGMWILPQNIRTGFNSRAFAEQAYGKAVRELIIRMVDDVESNLRCRPFSARITRVEDNKVWFHAGESSGIKPGDKFKVMHRTTFFDSQMRPTHQLNNTRRHLVVDDVHPNVVQGRLASVAQQANILPGDIVISEP